MKKTISGIPQHHYLTFRHDLMIMFMQILKIYINIYNDLEVQHFILDTNVLVAFIRSLILGSVIKVMLLL